ncbi:glycoside hydrolase family 76 protein [Flindersiella endophytica]
MNTRVRRAGALVAAATAFAVVAGAGAATPAQAESPWKQRAQASYDAMQTYLFLGPEQHNLYLERYPKAAEENPYSYLWPMREATAATLDVGGDVAARFDSLELYWGERNGLGGYQSYLPAPLGGGGDIFYDDNTIVGLEYIRWYAAGHDPAALAGARKAFDVVKRGWSTDTSLPCAGGMHWVEATWTDIRAANVTGLAAELAAHLYERTHQKSYLDWAKRLYDWNRKCLRSPEGLYWNDIGVDGTVNPTLWTYNSGAMIGAGALLYRTTHDPVYLKLARQDAAAALAYWSEGDRYFGQPAIFNAILFKNLLLLQSVAPDRAYRPFIERYATHIWDNNRDPSLGLFRFPPSGGGPYDPSYRPETLEQSAAVQIFAALAWSPRDYGRIA